MRKVFLFVLSKYLRTNLPTRKRLFVFLFVFAKCRGKQESPPSFMFSNKERTKAQQNSFFEMSLGSGGRFIVREGVSTIFIRGYPRALRYLLTLCFQKLFAFLVCVGFEKVLFEKFLSNSCISPQECMIV